MYAPVCSIYIDIEAVEENKEGKIAPIVTQDPYSKQKGDLMIAFQIFIGKI